MRATSIALLLLVACQSRNDPTASAPPAARAPTSIAPTSTASTSTAATSAISSTGLTQRTVLVELYSSQGCSSCPPADALLGRLPELGPADRVVALGFHVTYWDDLGWADPFAAPEYDARQAAYARALAGLDGRKQGPYTPQMVVDGRVHFTGSLADVARAQIYAAQARPPRLTLASEVTRRGDTLDVSLRVGDLGPPPPEDVGLFAALAQRHAETAVPRGENAGERLHEYAVVRALAGPRPPAEPTRLELKVPPDLGPDAFDLVVFAQDLSSLEILTAGVASLP